jgi:hypothetical protein
MGRSLAEVSRFDSSAAQADIRSSVQMGCSDGDHGQLFADRRLSDAVDFDLFFTFFRLLRFLAFVAVSYLSFQSGPFV